MWSKILICFEIFSGHILKLHNNLPLLFRKLSTNLFATIRSTTCGIIVYWLDAAHSNEKRIKFNSNDNQNPKFISLNLIRDWFCGATVHENMKLERPKNRNYTQKSMHDCNRFDARANSFQIRKDYKRIKIKHI